MNTKDKASNHETEARPGGTASKTAGKAGGTPDSEASRHLKGSAGNDPKTAAGQHAQTTQQSAGAHRNQRS